jgi:hypothetical protein
LRISNRDVSSCPFSNVVMLHYSADWTLEGKALKAVNYMSTVFSFSDTHTKKERQEQHTIAFFDLPFSTTSCYGTLTEEGPFVAF